MSSAPQLDIDRVAKVGGSESLVPLDLVDVSSSVDARRASGVEGDDVQSMLALAPTAINVNGRMSWEHVDHLGAQSLKGFRLDVG